MNMKMNVAKQRIAVVWFSGAGLLFFLVLIQILLGRYRDKSSEVWSFLLPTIVPTLSLVIGVLVMDALGKGVRTDLVGRFLYRLTIWISIAYLASVALIFLLAPLSTLPPLDMMSQSSLFLGPFQGLVSAAMGAFFVVAPEEKSPTATSG